MRTRSMTILALAGLVLTALVLHSCDTRRTEPSPTAPVLRHDVAPGSDTLTVLGGGNGSGRVSTPDSLTPAIACVIQAGVAGATGCSAGYDSTSVVTLNAVPDSGSTFGGWSGACQGAAPSCDVAMSQAQSVTATFTASAQIALTVTGAGNGSGTVRSQEGLAPAIACVIQQGVAAATGCSAAYDSTVTVTLTAVPDSGSSFTGWSGACQGAAPSCDVAMSQAQSVTATFTSTVQHALTITGAGNGNGTVSSQDVVTPVINCEIRLGVAGATGCGGSYDAGTSITLTATADAGSSFSGWSGACQGTTASCTVSMVQAQSVTASFTVTVIAPAARIGSWAPPVSLPIVAIHLHLLPTGNAVLFWTGDDATGGAANAYLWQVGADGNWVNGSLAAVPNDATDIFCSGHTMLADGRLLVAGGHIGNMTGLKDANVFDYRTNTWTRVADMAFGRWYPTVTELPDGRAVVLGGSDSMAAQVKIPELWNGTTWTQLTGAVLQVPYYPWMFVAPDGRLFMAGGNRGTRFLNVAGTGSWSAIVQFNYGSNRLYGSAVMYEPGKILIVGGGDPPTSTAEVRDLNAAGSTWRYTGAMTYARRQMNAVLLADGKVLAVGGTGSKGFNTAKKKVLASEMWNPATEQWTTMASLTYARLYHSTAILLPDGRVMSAGSGHPAATGEVDRLSFEVFSPPYLFNSDGSLATRPTITGAPTSLGYGGSFTVQTPDAGSIARVSWIRLGSTTHAFDQNQRYQSLSFTKGAGSLTVSAPLSANIAPPGHYMLFILNDRGVPSLARVVQIN